METVSVKYIAKQMLKYLWIAVLAGAVLAAAYVFLATKTETAAETDRVKRLTNYDGDYLSHPETKRYAIYRLVWEKDVVSQLTDAKWKIVDYSKELLSYIYQRLTSRAFSHMWYQELCKQFPEIKADQKRFSVSVIEKEMLGTGIEHCANLWIMIKAPLSLKEDEKPGYTDEQLCAYRDALYALVTETVESGALTDDLSVDLQRVEPLVEDSVSEQGYVTGTLEDDAEDQRSISKKKILLVFILGMVLVEGGIFLAALFDDRVKSGRELEANTNLTLLQVVGKNDTWTETALRLQLGNTWGKQYVLLGVGLDEEELHKSAMGLNAALDSVNGQEYLPAVSISVSENDFSWVLKLKGHPVIIAVRQLKSTYKALLFAAKYMQLLSDEICGAVLLTDFDCGKQKG